MNEFRFADGRRLSWREAGAGPPLLLLHGWCFSSRIFAEAFAAFSSTYRVLAPDLPGHGASDPAADDGFAALAGDLRAWLAALALDRIRLVGWSMGGQVALELAASLSSERVERLLLVAVTARFCAAADWPHGLPEGQVRAMERRLRRDYPGTLKDFRARMLGGEELPPARLREIAALLPAPPAPADALAALDALRREDQRSRLAALACPTLVQHGELDTITLPGAARYLADTIAGARLEPLPGIAHAPFLSRPDEVFSRWRSFLA
ncbi:alpha/beta fold hydrolase [Trichloromonas sp.]|uniref:alpha/beta fold hydrolase n=1 Tax=Trichloromonas sp. TaxID=3069249 RepID=UPI002A46BB2E|nr:alpha/beta fold hydrolase [Trichloromonas sp.]